MNAGQLMALVEAIVEIEKGESVRAMNNNADFASILAHVDGEVFDITVRRSRIKWDSICTKPRHLSD